MRWNIQPAPTLGQKRFVRRFLWFPTEIDGLVRWLEGAQIEQQYVLWESDTDPLAGHGIWEDRKWADLEYRGGKWQRLR